MMGSYSKWIILVGLLACLVLDKPALGANGNDLHLIHRNSPHFAFKFHPKDRLYMDPILEQAERLRNKIMDEIGAASVPQINVVMAFNKEEFNQLQPKDRPVPDWAVAVAYPGRSLMMLRSPRLVPGHRENMVQVFTHELTHLILAHHFDGQPIPRWLNEGVSMYVSYEWHPTQDVLMGKYILSDQLIPLQDLTDAFPADAFRVRQAYIQSYSLVNFMISTYGRENFRQLIQRLGEGESFPQAIGRQYGVTMQDFEANWLKRLRVRYNWIPFLTSSTIVWLFIVMVLVGAYYQRKKRAKKILMQWTEEEEAAAGHDKMGHD